jgi:hypothetical protein
MDIKLKGPELSRFKIKALIYLKALGVFSLTFLILFLVIKGINSFSEYRKWKHAVENIPEKEVRKLEMVKEQFSYDQVIQTWYVPPYKEWLKPINWLLYTENCIMCGRLNAMKFAGMIPGDWTVKDFKKKLGRFDFVNKWALHTGRYPLTDRRLYDISRRLTGNKTIKYKWYSIKTLDELIYLAKRGHHVFVYTQVWLGPSKSYPKAVKYLGKNYSHACTITGIKSYDPGEDLIEFSVNETLPATELTYTPVYSKLKKKGGCNLFDRQSIPYIIPSGEFARSGYILRVEDKKKKMKEKS